MAEEDDPSRSRLPGGIFWFRSASARRIYICQATAFGQAGADEYGADAAVLEVGMNGNGGEAEAS